MKKITLLFVSVIIATIGFAQTNFSGSRAINNSKSTLNEQFSMAPKEIIISQADNEMNVEKHSSFRGNDFTRNEKYTLDGKECINKGWRDTQKKSTAVWSDSKKMLTVTSKLPMRDNGEMTIVEVYQMDGDNLTIETSASSSFGDRSEKFVFDKK